MGLFDKAKEKWKDTTSRWSERKKAKQEKVDAREQKVDDRRDYKLDKIEALEEKSYAVAAKRKWLAIIMALGLVIYFVVFKGGFSFGGIGSALKGLF
jgi:Flp pilus assembly protein TadB